MSFRFAAVISHPIQHYSPIFRELAKVPGMEMRAFYSCDWGVKPTYDPEFGTSFAWDVPLLEGHDYEFLPRGRAPKDQSFFEIDNPRTAERLDTFAPHAVWIHGYGHRVCWRALRWTRDRAAAIYFGDSELLHGRSWLRRAVKTPFVRHFFRQCDAFVTIGDNNEAYYRQYGVPDQKMFRGACPVDVERFRNALQDPERPSRAAMRDRYGLPADATVAIYSAKMIPKKRPLDLVEAIGTLRDRGISVYALMLGDGPLRGSVAQRISDLGLEELVRLTGFVNQREIPLVLDAGDILAMTSEIDPHPLSVTESMIVGHPIVASDRIGCVGPTDSARPDVNALVYPVGNVAALADCLGRLATDEDLRHRMGEASRELAASQDVPVTVDAVLLAIRHLQVDFAEPWHDVSSPVLRGQTTASTVVPSC